MPKSENQERLAYSKLIEKLKVWPFARFQVPMMVDLSISDHVLQTLTLHGINYDDWTSVEDKERILLVDMDLTSAKLLEIFDPALVYFQTPDRLVSCS
jgi:hypothetical protein